VRAGRARIPRTHRALRAVMRALYARRGPRTLAHLLRPLLPGSGWVWIEDFDGDLRFRCNLDEHMGSYIYWRGAYSWRQLRVLDRILEPEMVFLDVGANQGEFTVFAAKRLVRGTVHAVEPMSGMRRLLEMNVRANGFTNVRVHPVALWRGEGRATLYTRPGRFLDSCRHDGLGTLFRSEHRPAAVEEVDVTTLDRWAETVDLERLDVVKLDVEGAELGVVQGGLATLERFRPVILLEANRDTADAAGWQLEELFRLLEPWYTFEAITSSGRCRPVRPERLGRLQEVLCRPR